MEENYFVNVLKVLDASIERGTWKGAEIEGVSNLRKLTLQAIKNIAEASQQEEEPQVESITKNIGEK